MSEETIAFNFISLPLEPHWWNAPVSLFTAMFLHASEEHLWGNMFFLWGVGTVVEKRIGPLNFLMLYLITGLSADIITILVEYAFLGQIPHGLGASGAISGIMGVYAVRCYFKTMILPIPFLGVLPVSIKIRMNALVMMGFFFLIDLKGGIGQITGESHSNIGYWSHLGGMLAAGSQKMGVAAMEERHTQIGLDRLQEGMGLGEGEKSLRIAIGRNEENVEAMLALARIKSRKHGMKYTLSDEGGELYRKVIGRIIGTRPDDAADLYVPSSPSRRTMAALGLTA